MNRNWGGWLLVCLFFSFGCEATWELSGEQHLVCESDADCPEGQACLPAEGYDHYACIKPDQPVCGNGYTETGEVCDHDGGTDVSKNEDNHQDP